MDSRRPSWTSCSPRVVVVPPRRAMPTSNDTRVRCEGFWKSIAMWRPSRGRPAQRAALIAWASFSTDRSSAGSRSATSRKSLPLRLTARIMMPRSNAAPLLLQAWLDQLAGNDRGDGEVPGGVELGQPPAQPVVVSQAQDEVPAGGGLEPEMGRLEAERRLVAGSDREPVGHPHLRPRVGVREGHGFHELPECPHLMPALDHDDAIAEETEPARRPGVELE